MYEAYLVYTVLCKSLEPPLIFYILKGKWEILILYTTCADIHGLIVHYSASVLESLASRK